MGLKEIVNSNQLVGYIAVTRKFILKMKFDSKLISYILQCYAFPPNSSTELPIPVIHINFSRSSHVGNVITCAHV